MRHVQRQRAAERRLKKAQRLILRAMIALEDATDEMQGLVHGAPITQRLRTMTNQTDELWHAAEALRRSGRYRLAESLEK